MIADDEEIGVVTKKRGLGRGLNALFEDEESVYPQADMAGHTPGRSRTMLGVDQMMPSSFQPRRVFHEEALEELAGSIRQHGLLQPILVRKALSGDRYEIIAGERRWRASQRAQLHEVPVVIMDLGDEAALEIALIENLQREDLDPIEEAAGYRRLIDQYGHTQEHLAKALGKSRSHIANMMRLLGLPERVQAYLSAGELSVGHARALVTAENPEILARQIIEKGLNVRETERLAAEGSGKGTSAAGGKSSGKGKDVDTLALEEELSNLLGMKVSIDAKGQKGSLKIQFLSLDQLDDLLHRLSHNTSGGKRLLG